MLHDPKWRPRLKVSATASLKFIIAEEPFLTVMDELPAIFARHGAESARAVLDPDWMTLQRMAALGGLRLVTARYGDILVGYCVNLLTYPVMYKSTLFGTTIAIWIDKPYRWGMNGLKLVRRNRELLLEWGCQRLYIATPEPRLGKVFERAGYRVEEINYVSTSNAGLSL